MSIAVVAETKAPSPQTSSDFIAFFVWKNDLKTCPGLLEFDKALTGAIRRSIKEEDFAGKAGSSVHFQTLDLVKPKRIAIFGLGHDEDSLPSVLLRAAAQVTRAAQKFAAKDALVVVPKLGDVGAASLIARGASLGGYRYTKYLSEKPKASKFKKFRVFQDGAIKKQKASLDYGVEVARGATLVRDLVNMPPIDLYPETFAKIAASEAKGTGIRVKVLSVAEMKKRGMNLILGVGAGSSRGPRMVHLSYKPTGLPKNKKPIVIVGKGVTFDSGGLSLKPPASMVNMKSDMAGAATALATVLTVARLKTKTEVHAILGLAENMPSGDAIRPDDVIKGASGKTVEINNTDAEGRLVLADCLHYATGLKPARIVDLATLTGACMVALGSHTVGAFASNDALANDILKSANNVGEDFWRMPLTKVLREQLRSDVADMKNTGERWGGAITAALFLKEFVGDVPWAHLDIAGPSTSGSDNGFLTKGGTGVALATLVDMIAA